ncbi:proline-rich protein 11 isoform X2 [Brienomyrus brachyistius]|nr:proline-rich protein 11 isoform X2 [Brienomyrus brachyistius]XP_048838905.1 proline-rich protein 11 isoform X2 [Brienomyrus brachyistius]XP_048838906.1 proline-rich protein 11 isoform X2 [Brienomyrus brachyistius]
MRQLRKRRPTSRRWALRTSHKTRPRLTGAAIAHHSSASALSPAEPDVSVDVAANARRPWLPRLGVDLLLKLVGRICRGWRFSIVQVCAGVLNKLLSWRDQTRQLETLRGQVEELQKEMVFLRDAVQPIRGADPACCCSRAGSAVDSVPAPIPLAPPPPPPPPPPPLPPLPLLPPPDAAPRRPVIVVTKKASSASFPKENVRLSTVTLRDLQSVKLRKVTNATVAAARVSSDMSRAPLITVADLQKVHLRRPHCDLALKPRLGVGILPNKSPGNLRKQLKKVQINRSPGGTPLTDKENQECGTGLTPIMTQALRRKFQIAIPRSPSPKLKKSFDEQN